MRRSLGSAVALAVGGLVLVACGTETPGSAGGAADPGGTEPHAPTRELGSVAPTSKPAPELTLTGTVNAGVEKGCLVLMSDAKAYVLIGKLPGVLPGSEVTVRGHEATNVRTTCQEGPPFLVTAVLRATTGTDPTT